MESQVLKSSVEFSSFDGEYVKRLSDGDSATENHFVSYFSGLLEVKLRRRLQSAQEVEDLRQEVFLRVLHNLRNGDGVKQPERFGAYVAAICNNVLLEHFRQQLKTTQWDGTDVDPATRACSAEQLLLKQETKMQVQRMIDGLSSKEQSVLRAIFHEERDKDSVCLEYGVTRDYLRVLLHRSKNRLRQLHLLKRVAGKITATNARESSL
jgi:RNA polymerase sigma-70 factor (ECF subfamily)